jgi:hypothetical protein
MNAARLIDSLERFAAPFEALIRPLPESVARRAPTPDAWSIHVIVCHLADEEVGDFRARVFSTLTDPAREWPPINPAGWVTSRDYASRSTSTELDRFLGERRDSLVRLRALVDPDWSATKTHPEFGAMTAGELLGAWAAHDMLHLRQVSRRLFEMTTVDAAPYGVGYAGDW